MGFLGLRRRQIALCGFVFLVACQGNMGSTPPVAPAGGYTPSNQSAAAVREQSVNATSTVTLSPNTEQLVFPPVGGFELTIQLHSPSPTPVPSPSIASRRGKKKAATSVPTIMPTVVPSPSPSPSVQPVASPSRTGKKKKGFGKASAGSQHFVDLTLTVYPNSAPGAPTAEPSAVPVLVRNALVRGEVHSQDALTLPSLGVVSFTLAKREQAPGRAFSIAVFEERKHRKNFQIAADVNSSADANGVVRVASSSKAILFEANHRYSIILYAEDLAPVAPPVAPPRPTGFQNGAAPSPGGSAVPSPGLSAGGLQGAILIR
jgi:hypothetical protein